MGVAKEKSKKSLFFFFLSVFSTIFLFPSFILRSETEQEKCLS